MRSPRPHDQGASSPRSLNLAARRGSLTDLVQAASLSSSPLVLAESGFPAHLPYSRPPSSTSAQARSRTTSHSPLITTPIAMPGGGGSDFFRTVSEAHEAHRTSSTASSFSFNSSGSSFGSAPSSNSASMPDVSKFANHIAASGKMSLSLSSNSDVSPVRSNTAPMGAPKRGSAQLASSKRMTPISPQELVEVLRSGTGGPTVVLDLRPYSQYASPTGRVRNSVNVCIPSLSLKRASHTVVKIQQSLSAGDADTFGLAVGGKQARAGRVVVLDADSVALLNDSPMHSILGKFERDGFAGELRWVRGGASALSALDANNVYDTEPLASTSSDEMSADDLSQSSRSALSSQSGSPVMSKLRAPILQCRDLPAAAFQQSSTADNLVASMGLPTARDERKVTWPIAGGQTTGSASATRPDRSRRVAANPFFDNIRQNQEMLGSLQPFDVPENEHISEQEVAQLPTFLREFVMMTPIQRAEKLAREFYTIEQDEKSRLQTVLSWHANSTHFLTKSMSSHGMPNEADYNPLSISAGVEKGHLNRYKNIWPYDHSRVKLDTYDANCESDYINASHIQLRSSERHYIATQGPVAPAYAHFWQTVIQENVRVIVMLTHLHEGGREKCGHYFKAGRYGKITVQSEGGEPDIASASGALASEAASAGGFFSSADSHRASPKHSPLLQRGESKTGSPLGFMNVKPDQSTSTQPSTVRRRLLVSHDDDPPDQPPRQVTHIQYLAWPDFDVPPEIDDVLLLVHQVDEAQKEADRRGDHPGPILAHCSAGVGRTGSASSAHCNPNAHRLHHRRHDLGQAQTRTIQDSRSTGIARPQADGIGSAETAFARSTTSVPQGHFSIAT